MVIYPEVQTTPDTPTIKFYQPREQIDIDKELSRILHSQGWGCGTYFNVQFLNHEKTKLLACGRFVVAEEIESVQTNDANPYQPMTKTVFSRRAEQIGGWWPAAGLMMVDGSLVEAGIAHPPLIDRYSDGGSVNRTVEGTSDKYKEAMGETMDIEKPRRGRPPKAAAA